MKIVPAHVFIILLFLLVSPAYALDFTTDDFDPAEGDNAEIVEMYQRAVAELIGELTITGTDVDGTEVFRLLPFPMELIGLITQTEIHTSNITDPVELADVIESANLNKPAPNSFAFTMDGNPEWVGHSVSMYYFTDLEDSDGVEVPVYEVNEARMIADGIMARDFAVVIDSGDELRNFLMAPAVVILVGWGDPDFEPLLLDCSSWRKYAIFDLRDEDGSMNMAGNPGPNEE